MMGTEFVGVISVFELLFPTNETVLYAGGKPQQELLNTTCNDNDNFLVVISPVVPS